MRIGVVRWILYLASQAIFYGDSNNINFITSLGVDIFSYI
jgi:hypothetical protein